MQQWATGRQCGCRDYLHRAPLCVSPIYRRGACEMTHARQVVEWHDQNYPQPKLPPALSSPGRSSACAARTRRDRAPRDTAGRQLPRPCDGCSDTPDFSCIGCRSPDPTRYGSGLTMLVTQHNSSHSLVYLPLCAGAILATGERLSAAQGRRPAGCCGWNARWCRKSSMALMTTNHPGLLVSLIARAAVPVPHSCVQSQSC